MSGKAKRWTAGAAVVVACALLVIWRIAVLAADPAIPLLLSEGDAQWIRVSLPVGPIFHPGGIFAAEYRKTFTVTEVPADAVLRVRAFRRAEVVLNGEALGRTHPDLDEWKRGMEIDLGPFLAPGTHELLLRVRNKDGPPCVLAYCDGLPLRTGPGWEVRSPGLDGWQQAVTANAPQTNSVGRKLQRADRALWAKAPLLIPVFLLAACAFWVLGRRRDLPYASTVRWLILAAWAGLAANNITKLPFQVGFDVAGHLEYIVYVFETRRLPLATDGWQMFQSPLYYILSAPLYGLGLRLFSEDQAVEALRVIPLLCGALQVQLCYHCLKQVYPDRQDLQAMGTVLGGLLPINLYTSQSLGNEPLAGVLCGTVILIAIRLQTDPDRRATSGTFVLMGLALGLALLTKVSGILLTPPLTLLILSVTYRNHGYTTKALLESARALAIVFGIALVLCGWYYARNWIELGAPFVGGWETSHGIAWWQEPGYRTIGQFLGFGQALTYPMYSGVQGLWDGFYSTLWLDAYNGGRTDFTLIPSRNFGFLLSCAWLALLPTAALALGAAATVARPAHSALNGRLFALTCLAIFILALAYMTLRVPSYAILKASYTLGVLPCYAIVGAQGFDYLTRHPIPRALCVGWMACWAVSTYAAYFIL